MYTTTNTAGIEEMYMDDDELRDMPTPERLVPTDAPVPTDRGDGRPRPGDNIDNKVANFLAEIDALDPADENSRSPAPYHRHEREEEPAPSFKQSPPRERSRSPSSRHKSGAYNMFVKGKSEFTRRPEDTKQHKDSSKEEVWPEEPTTKWQQLKDEQSKHPYYWHTDTNAVVWEMPPEFSQYLLMQKEYNEKVERGLKEGKLNPVHRPKPREEKRERGHEKPRLDSANKHRQKKRDYSDSGSSSDSNSSGRSSRGSSKSKDKSTKRGKTSELPSSSTAFRDRHGSRDGDKPKKAKLDTPELPDSTEEPASSRPKVSPPASTNDDSMDFDDIDKELEMALERKRQELIRLEKGGDPPDKDTDKGKPRDKDRDSKLDTHKKKGQDDDRKHGRHRRYDDRRDERRKDDRRHGDRDKDRDRDRDRISEKEVRQSRLSLKDRLKIEMELKMEKEKRKKKQIEEMMAKELEKTVGSSKGHKRSHRDRDTHRDRDDEPRKRYRDETEEKGDPRDENAKDGRAADDYRQDYSGWGRESRGMYDDMYETPRHKPPPPTQEMIESESERKSKVVDYGHGRTLEKNSDFDVEDKRSADVRDLEMKKLEALQLAELALSKLEFLEVTKKGLSKLQILLIELETRHQDWQSGGLTTNHFLGKLREANWQLEQYEDSAAPSGWLCHWDRDYRRYFYTHKLTSKTQWEYPTAVDVGNGDGKDTEISSTSGDRKLANSTSSKTKKSVSKEILTSASLPPPPPPPAEEHPLVKTLCMQYGSTSESEDEEKTRPKETKKIEESIPLPPSLPPSLPTIKEEKSTDREKKEKHKKKKKKEKSKRKDKEKADQNVPVGPMLPAGPPVDPNNTLDGQPISYTSAEIDGVPITYTAGPDIDGQPMEFGTEGAVGMAGSSLDMYDVSYDPAVNAPLSADGTATQVPVYGQQPGADQNDQPLDFNSAELEEGSRQGQDLQQPEPTYAEGSYPDPYTGVLGAVDSGTTPGLSESQDPPHEAPAFHNPGTDEKKKKKEKKDTMSGVNISLKKKHVSSLVQKWQKVKKEVEQEERHREERDSEIRRKLEEWKQDGL